MQLNVSHICGSIEGDWSCNLPMVSFVGAQTSINLSSCLFGRQWYWNLSASEQFCIVKWHCFLSFAIIHSVLSLGQASTNVSVGIDWVHPLPSYKKASEVISKATKNTYNSYFFIKFYVSINLILIFVIRCVWATVLPYM